MVGALCGGLSSFLIFMDNLGIVMTVFKILTAILTVLITFGFKPPEHFLKRVFFLFAITFVFGGVALAVYMFFDKDILLYSNGIVYFDVDMTFLVICSVVSYIIITLLTKFTDKKAPKNKEYMVCIENNSKSISCMGLMDTGNNLRDPFSGYPVIMVEKSLFQKLYNEEKVRLIPVSTVNGESIIKAFRPQKFTIGDYSTDKVYIGECVTPLNEYKIILNINLEGEMHND